MAGDAEVGSIIGYLRLDRSDWDSELRAAGAKADELSRHNPNIKIGTNAPSAIAQLAAVAAATKRLQDAQGAEAVAEAKLADLRNKGDVSAGRMAAAENNVEKARRNVAAATIALAAAHDANDRAVLKATQDTDKLAKSADKTAQSFKVGLIPALAAIAPAAVPIAGVATGALIGLLPVAATVMLAVKGIENQMKAGALQGTQFAQSVDTLKSELTTLETTAAGGLMSGVNKALSESAPLFKTLNQDIGVTSVQLGNIVAGAAPALLRIFTDLNPLFVTFGNLITQGADKLDHWAQSSTGMQTFVAYVQAELPTVMSFLGNLITLVSHLAQGMAPFGGVLLNDLNLFVHALDAIPIGVLQAAVPLVVALYAAVKTYQGLDLIAGKVSAALATMSGSFGTSAGAASAASLATQAAVLEEEAAVATAKASEAAAAAEAATAIAAAAEEQGSVLAAAAAASAEAAIEFAAAMQTEADAAVGAASTISAQAAAAAEASTTAGEAASIGWASMLGPVGAIAVGVGILSMAFQSNSQAAQQNQEAINNFAQALEQSNGVVDESVQKAIVKRLVDSGAIDDAKTLGVNTAVLTQAVIGNAAAQAKLNAVYAEQRKLVYSGKEDSVSKQAYAVTNLSNVMGPLIKQFASGRQTAAEYLQTLEQSEGVTNSAAVASAKLYGLTGTAGVTAYLTAAQAAAQNTQQTQAQTLAFQLENNAAGLVNQALQTLAGQNLNVAQAQTAVDQATLSAVTALKQNKDSLSQNTTAGLADRQALEGQASSARQAASAIAQQTGSNDKAIASYKKSKTALEDQLRAQGLLTPAVQAYINKLYSVQAINAYLAKHPTTLDVRDRATAKINNVMASLRGLNNKTFTAFLTVQASVKNAQAMKGQDQGGPLSYPVGIGQSGRGTAGYASGTNDAPAGWAWVGEQGPELVNLPAHSKVLPHRQSMDAAAGKPTIVNNIYPQPGQSEREIGRAAGDEIAWALAR